MPNTMRSVTLLLQVDRFQRQRCSKTTKIKRLGRSGQSTCQLARALAPDNGCGLPAASCQPETPLCVCRYFDSTILNHLSSSSRNSILSIVSKFPPSSIMANTCIRRRTHRGEPQSSGIARTKGPDATTNSCLRSSHGAAPDIKSPRSTDDTF